jgi:diketogulonate reductase-like aldo/keto reductase
MEFKMTKSRTTKHNVTVPWLIYGTAWKKERTKDLVIQAVKQGFKGIDTACQPLHYNEPMVGEALKELEKEGFKREDLYLQTKYTPLPGHDPNQIPYDKEATLDVQVAQSFETSQKNLKTNYVDTLILHSAIQPHSDLMTVWTAMENIYNNGGAKQLGISNCYDINIFKTLFNDANIKPVVLQNRFYKESGYDVELRTFCQDNNVLYESFWTLTANPHILQSDVIQGLIKKYNKTESQVFFRCLNQMGITPLTGTTSKQHMIEDLNVFDFELTDDEIANICALLK